MKNEDAVLTAFCMTNGVLDKLVLAGSPVHATDKTFLSAFKTKVQAGATPRVNLTEVDHAVQIFVRYMNVKKVAP